MYVVIKIALPFSRIEVCALRSTAGLRGMAVALMQEPGRHAVVIINIGAARVSVCGISRRVCVLVSHAEERPREEA